MSNLDVTTTSGEAFTERDSAALAFLIFRRWGRDLAAATSAWRRLLGNSCTEDQFAALVSAGRDALVLPREEAARIVEALAEYEARPREADGSRDLSDGACTLPALRPLVRLATGG